MLTNRVRSIYAITNPSAAQSRAQAGLDRLVLFVILVLVLLYVGPMVLGYAGIDVREGAEHDDFREFLSYGEPVYDIEVLGSSLGAIDDTNGTAGAVEVTVTSGPGQTALNLNQLQLTWVGDETYSLRSAESGGGDGTFTVSVEGGGTIIDDSSPVGVVTVDLGTDDVRNARPVGDRLGPGETGSLIVETPDGQVTIVAVEGPSLE